MAQAAQAAQANVFDATSSQIQVEHDKKRRQFVIRLNGSHDRAVLLYEYVGKKTVDFATHRSSRCLQRERNSQAPGQGSHGFCGGRGSESPLDLLVHSEICQRESSASVL
ncbi:Protein NATD1 [Larimichthys crocea]|uniref:Uncharacterized protein n=1 Tax=Larimichthys crocea TaxID=215358 RepID=A0ACD3R875_LARCR|nr:Protein NATD1 [Larimichthys crocea]